MKLGHEGFMRLGHTTASQLLLKKGCPEYIRDDVWQIKAMLKRKSVKKVVKDKENKAATQNAMTCDEEG